MEHLQDWHGTVLIGRLLGSSRLYVTGVCLRLGRIALMRGPLVVLYLLWVVVVA